jgi:hypothetical protein
MRHAIILAALLASGIRADTLSTLKAQNVLRDRGSDDVTLGEVIREGKVRRMAPPRESPGRLVHDKDGTLSWHLPDGAIVPARLAATARDPSSLAAARAELENAVLSAAKVKHGKQADKAAALLAAADEHKSKGGGAAKGAGLLAAGAALGAAAQALNRRKKETTA